MKKKLKCIFVIVLLLSFVVTPQLANAKPVTYPDGATHDGVISYHGAYYKSMYAWTSWPGISHRTTAKIGNAKTTDSGVGYTQTTTISSFGWTYSWYER